MFPARDRAVCCRGGIDGGRGTALAIEVVEAEGSGVLRRISALRTRDWRDHFPSLNDDAILAIIDHRVLHYWGEDGFYRIYATSAPLSDEMTRRGRRSGRRSW